MFFWHQLVVTRLARQFVFLEFVFTCTYVMSAPERIEPIAVRFRA